MVLSTSLEIRAERDTDGVGVHAVIASAFGRSAEAELVERLRGLDGVFGFVAVQGDQVIGHVLFSPVKVDGVDGTCPVLGLGPLAVRRDMQSLEIGTRLVNHGILKCRQRNAVAIVVLGHRTFYPRFGFVEASRHGLRCKWSSGSSSFMVMELRPGVFDGSTRNVEYAPPFDEF